MKSLFKIFSVILSLYLINGCESVTPRKGANSAKEIKDFNRYSNTDSDNDYIPDNIEALIGTDMHNSDENHNNIPDGLESSGKFGDTYLSKEWYIYSTGQVMNQSNKPAIAGNDLDLMGVYHNYMGYNHGKPIGVQVVDYGVDTTHEDLKDNISLKDSYNGGSIGNPNPTNSYFSHGTKIAGIIAARAFNGKGVRGIAPFAKIAGSNWLINQDMGNLEKVWLGGNVVVSNNSWGTYFNTDTLYEKIMKKAQELRGGKGRAFVFAGGNDRSYGGDTNLQYIENNRFAITVGALAVDDTYAPYSTPGANLFISAYGGSISAYDGPTIATTTISGQARWTFSSDSAKNYTYAMSGTSAAAPMVSGAIALINEACPNLKMRDVKYLIATNAKIVDAQNSSWVTNSAGIEFSTDYGFGKIDTKAVIDACKSGYTLLGKELSVEASNNEQENIADSATISKNLAINGNINIEQVELTINIDSDDASEYRVYLISPSGTKIRMLRGKSYSGDSLFIPTKNWMNGGFRVTSPAFLDENSQGTWRVDIEDIRNNGNKGILKGLKLKIFGH